ncbi:hypothetical protein M422DRAFT_274573 [Sphaerobolus stellatus SS14]|uniref:Uncharacterized protein n=1 Tax=Sphaerobolus stellatus (strain SS14) TaxID=990650 RepID=A0A0C9T6M8_SPHS4|nr:hypothetical protein M422DRAFT_274573 [Sphaerobolus stellatus SS14]
MNYLCSQITNIPYSGRESINAVRAKAATLFERTARVSLCFNSVSRNTEQLWVDFQNLDAVLTRLSVSLPAVRIPSEDPHAHPSTRPRIDVHTFIIHSLIHASAIQLHSPFAFKEANSQQKCLSAATLASTLASDLEESDFPFLDPIMGTCWTLVADVLLRELLLLRGSPAMEQQLANLNHQLDTIILAMKRCGRTTPLVAYQANKVEQSRPDS